MDWKFKRWLVRWGPTTLFVATLGAAFWLHGPMDGPGTVLGFAEGEEVAVSSMETSRVLTIHAEPGQKVKAGEILVELDPASLEAEIAIAEAEVKGDEPRSINRPVGLCLDLEVPIRQGRQG